ncbi:hypothetical protein OQA88_2105 [Cercophora sp. LCS_1]
MASPTVISQEPFSKFAEFVAETKLNHIGRDIAGNEKRYVPLSALRGYWTASRISRVLHAFSPRLDIAINIIKRHYLRIFSTLVYTGRDAVQNLQLFIKYNLSDEVFPSATRPTAWADAPIFREFFDRIVSNQWQFFPLHFDDKLHDRQIHRDCILPIDAFVTIHQTNTTAIQRFDIHPDFNHLDEAKRTFVFKIYHNQKYESYYENELRALQRLDVDPSPNVVKFYGSFRQLGSYCLILEYADGGDLGEFFDKWPAPPTVQDTAVFWGSLFQVFAGLDRIHQLMSYDTDEVIKGIHEDIRPENILLMKGASGSPYDFTPKIADFGLYSRVRTAKSRSSPPECCHHTTQRHKGPNMITTSADIFSMGAVLSHTAAWVVGGVQEQKAYFQSRMAHHKTRLSRFLGSGYEGCFHDSIQPLPVIKEEHRKLGQRCQACDDVTPKVLEWAEQLMLRGDPRGRSRARDILEIFERFMDDRRPSVSSSSSSPSLASPSPAPATNTSEVTQSSAVWSPAEEPPTAIGDVSPLATTPLDDGAKPLARPPLQRSASPVGANGDTLTGPPEPEEDGSGCAIDNMSVPARSGEHPQDTAAPPTELQTRQAGGSQSGPASPSPTPSSAPQVSISEFNKSQDKRRQGKPVDPETAHLVDYLEHNLSGRDQLFFIDDSQSMAADKERICDGFRALACIAKKLDPNQIELVFASRPQKVHKSRRTKRLRDLVAKCQYKLEGHLMEDRIGELIDNVIIPHLPFRLFGFNVNIFARKKLSVYIFTDGNWGDEAKSGNACGVEGPVKKLIEEMKKRRLDRTQVSLHFVRFGDKENGRLHLKRLDECGEEDNLDIVDVKHIKTGVAGMMLGPLTRSNDDIPGG